MKNKRKILIGVIFYNEAEKVEILLEKFKKLKLPYLYKVIFLDDGSADGSVKAVKEFIKSSKDRHIELISNTSNRGVGFSIRRVIHFGLDNNFDICVLMAGNGKDDPEETRKLLEPIVQDDFDYIQGSRFLEGGSFKNLPFLRSLLIRGFTLMMYIFTGFKCTDATNGFRAYKFSIFKDLRINLDQQWLDRYELETYLHYKVITLGYKIKEVPVSKNYLPNIKNYSKIRPVVDWWKLARPIFLLKLGVKN